MRIIDVDKGSVGEELGIKQGDELIAFDGHKVVDILDYDFYNESECFVMTIARGSEETEFDIEKDSDEDLGLNFDAELSVRVCRNKCIFCFVDQLPKRELRKSLHVKDDDYRYSFISGSYVTLTNVSDEDLERIVRLKLSPLYISIHTSDNELRRKMLGNPKAPDIMKQLGFLHDGGIKIHAQIVYCPGINEDVAQTAIDTAPYCESLAVVPVGLTKDCNTALRCANEADARRVVSCITPLQKEFLEEKGTRYVFLADEFYVIGKLPVPDYEHYEDFVQIENGVGMIALFKHEIDFAIGEMSDGEVGAFSVATGVAAYETIKEAAEKVVNKFGGSIKVFSVVNSFFGESVTVAGLVTGGDIYNRLKGESLGDYLMLPRCMLKEFGDVFLDNMSVNELEHKLGTKIKIVGTDGVSFVKGCVHNE